MFFAVFHVHTRVSRELSLPCISYAFVSPRNYEYLFHVSRTYVHVDYTAGQARIHHLAAGACVGAAMLSPAEPWACHSDDSSGDDDPSSSGGVILDHAPRLCHISAERTAGVPKGRSLSGRRMLRGDGGGGGCSNSGGGRGDGCGSVGGDGARGCDGFGNGLGGDRGGDSNVERRKWKRRERGGGRDGVAVLKLVTLSQRLARAWAGGASRQNT